ncbi:MAG: tRNA (N6-threonylcarbamoyladenosine(37)-N6)-methyltransferase TrmO [Gammaproteobacteria bacterium]|nr:tRNA (N6-threonylcarbamoyladenosine(37)-N6)-methyltransferase TrmO [Gammaproteobacteria bacterium]MCW8993086.1 tRNA (N6-threonylcarbamoyladenosine(37)-N6)-methyltransferase TrmO [Gammaproteobacteria bacterium]
MQTFNFDPIGIVHSPYREKFGIPRQPGLVDVASTLELLSPYNRPEAVKGLEEFSHIWISFVFHALEQVKWRPTVRPPRLGGNSRVGVFASRSTHRPNPLGLSVVALEGIEIGQHGVCLRLGAADLLDGTPVLDIKPYIPYVDSIHDARGGFAPEAPPRLEVHFLPEVAQACRRLEGHYPGLERLIREVLAQDPRPAYQAGRNELREYGVALYDLNVRFRIVQGGVEVTGVEPAPR